MHKRPFIRGVKIHCINRIIERELPAINIRTVRQAIKEGRAKIYLGKGSRKIVRFMKDGKNLKVIVNKYLTKLVTVYEEI